MLTRHHTRHLTRHIIAYAIRAHVDMRMRPTCDARALAAPSSPLSLFLFPRIHTVMRMYDDPV